MKIFTELLEAQTSVHEHYCSIDIFSYEVFGELKNEFKESKNDFYSCVGSAIMIVFPSLMIVTYLP